MSIDSAKDQEYDGYEIFADEYGGAVLIDDYWYPFGYFTNGELDITDKAFNKKELAFKAYKDIYT